MGGPLIAHNLHLPHLLYNLDASQGLNRGVYQSDQPHLLVSIRGMLHLFPESFRILSSQN